jgi:hypothetical protein
MEALENEPKESVFVPLNLQEEALLPQIAELGEISHPQEEWALITSERWSLSGQMGVLGRELADGGAAGAKSEVMLPGELGEKQP